MNVQHATPYQFLLDPAWHIAIQDEIAINPCAIPFSVEPELCGRYDCEIGLPCIPLVRGYRTLGDIAAYELGFNAAQAAMLAAVEKAIDYEAKAEDYEEYMLDQEDWARGGW